MSELITLARGDASRITEPRRMLVRTADEWRALWALHAGPDTEPPNVDFDRHIVAAAFAGERPSSGYRIEIVVASDGAHGVGLGVNERTPPPGTMAAQIMTAPFHIATLPRTADVRWSDSGPRAADPVAVPDPTSRVPQTVASSTGLDPRTASVLAYLAGPFSGAIMLVAESANDDVRFHAWQSIVALGGLGLIVLLGYVTAVASLFVSATAVSFIVRLSTVLWIVLLVVWAICLWRTYSDGRWKLPVVGDWAERLASRR